MTRDFFSAQTGSSAVKTEIVTNYFAAWASIIARQIPGEFAYVDLFSGPGRYEDGSPSTPLVVLERIAGAASLRDRIITVFNDKNAAYTE